MTELFLRIWTAALTRLHREEAGQSTIEYVFVCLIGAAVAGLLLTWAHHSGGITGIFTKIVGKVLSFI